MGPLVAVIVVFFFAFLIYWILIRSRAHTEELMQYFMDAAQVHIIINEPCSRLAALAVAKSAPSQQRAAMVRYLEGLSVGLVNHTSASAETEAQASRLGTLKEAIAAKDWTVDDIFEAKKELGAADEEYLKALDKFDADIFARQYPALFKGED